MEYISKQPIIVYLGRNRRKLINQMIKSIYTLNGRKSEVSLCRVWNVLYNEIVTAVDILDSVVFSS